MEASYISHAKTSLFILLHLSTYFSSCLGTSTPILPIAHNTNYIKISCDKTLYPLLCYNSLSKYANKIQTSPRLLAITALYLTLSSTKSISSFIKTLSKQHGLKPTETEAMLTCVEELIDAVYELQRSTKEMAMSGTGGGSNFWVQMSDVQTWVSAALTDDNTCMDGFDDKSMNGMMKTVVRSHVLKIAHLTSIALALVNNYAAT